MINIIDQYLTEGRNEYHDFIIHIHDPRRGSEHYDLRIMDPYNDKKLLSFAFPFDFLNNYKKKTVGVKTRDHDPRWLTLKSHRLEIFDRGDVTYKTFISHKFIELTFYGRKIKGSYKLFKIKSKRDDNWILIKNNKE